MIRTVCIGLAAVYLFPALVEAQSATSAALRGRVTAPAGEIVAGARVVATLVPTGASAETTTDARGRYYLPNLRPGGPYTVRVGALGYTEQERGGIHLQLGQTLTLDVAVSEAPIALERIEARADKVDPVFATSHTGAETIVGEALIEVKPTISRNFMQLAEISPLARVDGQRISIAGQNDRYNAIQIDGSLSQDVFGQSPGGLPGSQANLKLIPLAAIQEYQVLVAPFDARQSGFTGGLINAVTRGGTNEWQGSAFGHYRDESLLGELTIDGARITPEQFDKQVFGFSLGGPIRRDRVHFFAAGELERRRDPTPGFSLGTDDPIRSSLSPDSAARAISILQDRYGMDPGSYGRATHDNPLANLFARVDAQLTDRHRLTARHNFAGAEIDGAPNRSPVEAYELGSSGFRFETRTHTSALQLVSTLSDRVSNDLLFTYTRVRERTDPLSRAPRVEVDINSSFDGGAGLYRRLRAGAALHAQENELDQDIIGVRNDLSASMGAKFATFGAGVELFRIRHLFLPGSMGAYRFRNLADLEANRPYQYDVNALLPGVGDRDVRFSVLQPSVYAQNEWSGPDGLTLRFGMRIDVPLMLDSPEQNPHEDLESVFDVSTATLPAMRPLFSPRFGFNWQSKRLRTTQFRGGAGIFTGRPPFVWLANAFANTGTRSVFRTCLGENAPELTGSGSAPTACADGGTGVSAPTINVFSSEFRFPQELKFALGVDQALPLGLTGSAEVLYSHGFNQIALRELNLGFPIDDKDPAYGYSEGFGFKGRNHYGTPTVEGFAPVRRSTAFAQVVEIGNTIGNYAYAATGELQRAFGESITLRASYAYSRARDVQSLASADATSNFGLNPTSKNPNNPDLRPSDFDRPHKFVGSAWYRWRDTELSLFYVGQSGRLYSYTYLGDVNGDGYSGYGAALDGHNDLIYVPLSHSETPGSIVTTAMVEQLISQDPCLQEHRGRILPRNACRAPWQNRLDLRFAQTLRVAGGEVQVTGDLVNVLNMVNAEWGRVSEVRGQIPVFKIDDRIQQGVGVGPSPRDPLTIHWAGPVQGRPGGGVRAALPYTVRVPDSQWQAQLGMKVTF